ncbi:hypothetical protein [Geothrix limicola]|uniref:hypothetical protein n=1 Tax=Geothrix limicola TaxID=2927978 RepID=UPI002554E8D0|nr:hypothetical protein [Geothrix limicola]
MKALFSLLLAVPLAAQITINLNPGGTNEKITLISKTGSVELTPGSHHHNKVVQLFTKTFTAFMKPAEKTVEAQPETISFGKIRPTKGRNTVLVRLSKDGEYFKAVLKEGMSGFSAYEESIPYPGKKAPEPVKQPDGIWTLTLPEPLTPGDYALVSDTENWQFHVAAAK